MKQLKALIADDHAEDRKVLRYYLEARGGQVFEAADGAEGFELAIAQKPDLIISDALMPNVDGFQFLKNVRSSHELLGTPFIFYSAVYTGQQDQDLAFSLGADAFIVKPKDPEEFWAEVKSVLDKVVQHKRQIRDEVVEEETLFLKKYNVILAKKVEQTVSELRVSEERFRDMVENSPDWFWEVDRDVNYTYVSPKIKDLLGYEVGELQGKTPFDLMAAGEAERVHYYFDPIAEKSLPFFGLVNVNQHKDGHEVVVESSGIPIFSPDGEFQGYRGIDRDITRRRRIDDALRQSERRFRMLYEQAPMCIHEIDLNGRLTAMNPTGLRMMGVKSEEEICGLAYLDIVSPEEQERINELLQRACAGEPSSFEFTSRSQGARVYLSSFIPVTDDHGVVVKLMGVTEDITDRKRAEEEIRTLGRRNRILVEHSPVGIFYADANGECTYVNRRCTELAGVTAEQALGAGWTRRLHPEDSERIIASWRRIREQNIPFKEEYRFVNQDGSIIWAIGEAVAELDEKGVVQGYIGTLTDITSRKIVESALATALVQAREAKQQIDALLESVVDALILSDSDNQIILLNRTAEGLLGISLKESRGKLFDEVVKEQILVDHVAAILAGRKIGVPVDLDLVDQGTKEVRTIQAMTSVAHDREGEKTGVITILRDVTRERESDRLKSEFIATAAHELRTPLTSIMGYAQVLLDWEEGEEEQRREFLTTIVDKSLVLEKIIEDLLNLSRIESGRAIYVEKACADLGAALERVVAEFQREYPSHRFEMVSVSKRIMLWMDEGRIVQVMENLLGNAAKFSPAGSLIRVNCEVSAFEVQVAVSDEGIGMTSEQVARMFDKFYRVDVSDTARQGLGLGMAIVKGIVEAHNGRVWVESALGEGTRVFFTLPLGDCPPS